MKKLSLLFCLLVIAARPCAGADEYTLGPDSQRHPGVPRGAVTHYAWTSKIFPGTVRDYWVYVPAQYSKTKPACVMVFQDGESFMKDDGRARIPIVFDNLIAKHEMPVTIGIFINPGVLKAHSADQQDRFNRSFEYDALGDRYATFLLDEILPEVAKHYNLSANPDDRAISGLSSGGICAFNVAWERPDAFHRVLSFIGSFTDLRGGDIFPSLIRKTEPKPLRVFLQDGDHDLNLYAGSWWLANQSVASALAWAGYDVKFVSGNKDHDMLQGGAILPDALRWLWRDYPKPIAKPGPNYSSDQRLAILDPGHEWEMISRGFQSGGALAVGPKGEVFFNNRSHKTIEKLSTHGMAAAFPTSVPDLKGMVFGPEGRLYACEAPKGMMAYTSSGVASPLVQGSDCDDLAVTHDGGIYFTYYAGNSIQYMDAKGKKQAVTYLLQPNSVFLSADESLLYVADTMGKCVWSFQIQPDGSLGAQEDFYHLKAVDDSLYKTDTPAQMAVDTLGHLYVTTHLGIQVLDQPGRVVTIINSPEPGIPISGMVFGGPDLEDLYVAVGTSIFKRHLLRKGVLPWAPVKPPVPHL
ncbi:MAG TPA: SMP-30/gluconolactonase/LRE family protein [Terriglobia bacterium]|nr:SMP-30/gluconolactonase/LRE family protein [Terriglobia bacterium]